MTQQLPTPVKVTTGDTQPLLTSTLRQTTDPASDPVDLTEALSVAWQIRRGEVSVTKAATIVDAVNGVTTFQWDGDPDIVPAFWQVRSVIHWNDGTVETTVDHGVLEVLPVA